MSDDAMTLVTGLMNGQKVAGLLAGQAGAAAAGALTPQQQETEKLLESSLIIAGIMGMMGNIKGGVATPDVVIRQVASEFGALKQKAKQLAATGDSTKLNEALKRFNQSVGSKARESEAKLRAMMSAQGKMDGEIEAILAGMMTKAAGGQSYSLDQAAAELHAAASKADSLKPKTLDPRAGAVAAIKAGEAATKEAAAIAARDAEMAAMLAHAAQAALQNFASQAAGGVSSAVSWLKGKLHI